MSLLALMDTNNRSNVIIVDALQHKPKQWGYWENDNNEGKDQDKDKDDVKGEGATSLEQDMEIHFETVHNAGTAHSVHDLHTNTEIDTNKIAKEAAAEAATEEEVLLFAHTNRR